MRRNETSASARAAGQAKAQETRARRAALNDLTLSELRAQAKADGVKGYSTKTKSELVTLLVRRAQGKAPKREKVTLGEAKKRLAAGRTRALKGRGPFRMVIVKDGNVYADLGPYAAARGAQTDAKTLLRRVVGDTHSLYNRDAQEAIDAGEIDADAFGAGTRVVDGWVAGLKEAAEAKGAKEIDAQAWVIGHPTAAKKKKKGAKDKDDPAFAKATVPAALRNNGRASVADDDAAHELVLYAQNDGRLYTQTVQPIMANLARKLAAGRFDRDLAVKGMGYLADAAAKAYTKEISGGSGFGIFSAATRRRAAADLLDGYMEEIEGLAASMGGKRKATRSNRKATRSNPIVAFQTKDGPVSFRTKKNPLVGGETPIVGVSRAGSGWAVVGPGVNIPVKLKSDAESIVREIKSYGRYAGRDHMGEKINGFLVGGRYGYYAVDEMERGDNPGRGGVQRTVASGITRRAATELARVLNETLT